MITAYRSAGVLFVAAAPWCAQPPTIAPRRDSGLHCSDKTRPNSITIGAAGDSVRIVLARYKPE